MFNFAVMSSILVSIFLVHNHTSCSETTQVISAQESVVAGSRNELSDRYIIISNSKGLISTIPARKWIILKPDQDKSSK